MPAHQPFTGGSNGRHRTTITATPSSTTDESNSTDLGAYTFTTVAIQDSPDPAIEDAGIRAGEIIAYRAWWLQDDGLLHAMFWNHIWQPGAVERVQKVDLTYGTGLHAFKTLEKTKDEYRSSSYGIIVYGEVALWGEVIEHERGYRAEYASIRKLIAITGFDYVWRLWRKSKLDVVRERYGLALTPAER